MGSVVKLFKEDQLASLLTERKLVSIARDNIDYLSIQGFILAYSKELVLIQYIYDFRLEGLIVLRRRDITAIETSQTDEFQTDLLKEAGVFSQIDFTPAYDLTNWESVLNTLGRQAKYIIVENEALEDPEFCIGELRNVTQNSVDMLGFNGVGRWDDAETTIHHSEITSLQAFTNYITFYQNHFDKIKPE